MDGQSQQPPSGQASSSRSAGTICSAANRSYLRVLHTVQTGNLDNSSEPRYLTSNLPFACFAQSIADGCLEDCVGQNIIISFALAFPSSHLQAKPIFLHAAANQAIVVTLGQCISARMQQRQFAYRPVDLQVVSFASKHCNCFSGYAYQVVRVSQVRCRELHQSCLSYMRVYNVRCYVQRQSCRS